MKARGATLIQGVVGDYNSVICRTSLTTATETRDLSKACQQQLLQGALGFFSCFTNGL